MGDLVDYLVGDLIEICVDYFGDDSGFYEAEEFSNGYKIKAYSSAEGLINKDSKKLVADIFVNEYGIDVLSAKDSGFIAYLSDNVFGQRGLPLIIVYDKWVN